jgi:hypothetical protein
LFVEHSYHDRFFDPLDGHPAFSLNNMHVKTPRGPRGGVTVAFPEKLHDMLSRLEEEGDSHIISWQPHGRCFLIHNKREFVDNVMARYYIRTSPARIEQLEQIHSHYFLFVLQILSAE